MALDEEEVDVDALIADANKHAAAALKNAQFDGGEDDDDLGLNDDLDVDINDKELLAEYAALGLGGDTDEEDGGGGGGEEEIQEEVSMELKDAEDNHKSDEKDDAEVFESLKKIILTEITQKIQTIETKKKLFQEANDNLKIKHCQQAIQQLQAFSSAIQNMEAIDYATQHEEYQTKVRKIAESVKELPPPQPKGTAPTKITIDPVVKIVQEETGANDQEATDDILLTRYRQYKSAASQAAKAGDRETAKKHILSYKTIEQAMQQKNDGIAVWLSDIPPPLQGSSPVPVKIEVTENPTAVDEMKQPASAELVNERKEMYKAAALKAKQTDLNKAKKYFAVYQDLERKHAAILQGSLTLTVGELPPPIKGAAVHVSSHDVFGNKVITKVGGATRPKSSAGPSGDDKQKKAADSSGNKDPMVDVEGKMSESTALLGEYQKIIRKLKTQIEECKSDAAFLLHGNSKQAQELLHWQRESELALAKTIQCAKNQLTPLPKHELVTMQVVIKLLNEEIQENELRLTIGKLMNFASKEKKQVYVQFENEMFQGTTDTRPAEFDCHFDKIFRFKFERGPKAERKFKRMKLNMTLMHSRFLGHVELGKAVLKMESLMNEALIDTMVEFKDSQKKKVGNLQVQIKLRYPIAGEGTQAVTRHLLRITEYPGSPPKSAEKENPAPPPPSNAPDKRKSSQTGSKRDLKQTKPAAAAAATTATAGTNKTTRTSVSENAKPKPPPQKANSNLPDGLTEEIVENPLDVMWIESFEVITQELEACDQQIKQLGSKPIPEELSDRLSALTIQKQTLEIQVQTGVLSVEDYSAKVKAALERDFALAKYLRAQDRKVEAVKVFQRVKIMKRELSGSEA